MNIKIMLGIYAKTSVWSGLKVKIMDKDTRVQLEVGLIEFSAII